LVEGQPTKEIVGAILFSCGRSIIGTRFEDEYLKLKKDYLSDFIGSDQYDDACAEFEKFIINGLVDILSDPYKSSYFEKVKSGSQAAIIQWCSEVLKDEEDEEDEEEFWFAKWKSTDCLFFPRSENASRAIAEKYNIPAHEMQFYERKLAGAKYEGSIIKIEEKKKYLIIEENSKKWSLHVISEVNGEGSKTSVDGEGAFNGISVRDKVRITYNKAPELDDQYIPRGEATVSKQETCVIM
jgi:hypothetical protein